MSLFAVISLAQGAGSGGAGGLGGGDTMSTLLLIAPMVLIFYFFLIRPQTKKAKEHQSFLDTIKRGDKVITSGGIWGKVAAVTDKTVDLEISNNVKVRITKGSVAGYQQSETPVKPT